MKNLLAKRVKKNNKGFTLVELIIVIAIIAILVAVLAPNYVRYVDKSRWSDDRNTAETLLGEVRTAIVEDQDAGSDWSGVSDGTVLVTMNKTNTSIAPTAPSTLESKLKDADSNYAKGKVKNTGSAYKADSAGELGHTTYTIKYKKGGAYGEWS